MGASDSSLDGVSGGVGGNVVFSVTVICRVRDTEIVASAAISFAISGERGVVVKTTKYGIVEERENVTDVGRVTYFVA